MKILVTGGTGFLGTAICRKLSAQHHEVTALPSTSCDLTNYDSLRQFDGKSFDQIYHLAAWTQAGDFCLHHSGEQWIINQQINTNILAWWHNKQPQAKLICAGSSCAYDPQLPLIEENYLAGTPIDSLFTYALSKRMLYAGLLALHQQFGHRYLCLVPSTLYGPGYPDDGRQKHFIFDLMAKIIRGKLHGEPVVLWGDGKQSRELIHIDDFVDIMVSLADTRDNDIVNAGSGQEQTIRYFAQHICAQVGYPFEQIEFDETRYVGAKSKCLDVEKLRSLMPGLSLTPLETGLSQTVSELLVKHKEVPCNTQ